MLIAESFARFKENPCPSPFWSSNSACEKTQDFLSSRWSLESWDLIELTRSVLESNWTLHLFSPHKTAIFPSFQWPRITPVKNSWSCYIYTWGGSEGVDTRYVVVHIQIVCHPWPGRQMYTLCFLYLFPVITHIVSVFCHGDKVVSNTNMSLTLGQDSCRD